MAKTKDLKKTGTKAKSEVKPLNTVKNASITKPSQTPVAKSKAIAKETASKVNGAKVSKHAVKPASPSESESDSEDSSSDSSEDEAPAPKTNGKLNGKAQATAAKVDSSDSSSSDSSDEDSEDSASEAGDVKSKPAAAVPSKEDDFSDSSDSSSGESESESESEEDSAPVAVAKKVVETSKAAVNGAAKAVARATDDSDSSDSSEENSSESDSSDSDSDAEEEAPSKKRKADPESEPVAKKAKVESDDEPGSKNLFVGNLSWNVDDEWLLQEFKEFGEITGARVISDKATGRSKGFGYVEFANASDAAAALKAKKGALIDGREANVDFSTPRNNTAPRERAQGRAQQYGDSTNPPSDTLFLGNLSFDATEDIVGEAFQVHGKVVNIRLPTDQESGNPKGFGYITFASVDDSKAAFEAMTGAEIAGRPVRLDYATPRPERGDGGRGSGRDARGGFDRGGRGAGRGASRGGFDRGGRGSSRGGARGGRGVSTNRGGFGDFKGKKQTF